MLLSLSRSLLGKSLFSLLMKSTFYGHFVAGEDQAGIKPNIKNMMKYGVKAILDYSVEEDLDSHANKDAAKLSASEGTTASSRKIYNVFEHQAEKNAQIFKDCIEAVSDVTSSTGIAAIKVTSLLRPELLMRLSSILEQHRDSRGLEWKSLLAMNEKDFAKVFESSDEANAKFNSSELGELRNMFLRVNEIVELGVEKDVRIFVDAEQTYFQTAIRRVTIELMRHFNKKKCFVLNTYQNYLKGTFDTLKEDLELAEREHFCFGAKLVRGAYMEQERERAVQMGYADPINESYDHTTRMYEKSLVYCLDLIKKRPQSAVCVMVASHNEETVKFAVQKMDEYKIKPGDRLVCFGQLLGMCDYISFYLGGVGYSVYKYVPYGPVEEVLPYLSRRATENRGIFEKVKKEKRLILAEIKRRLFASN